MTIAPITDPLTLPPEAEEPATTTADETQTQEPKDKSGESDPNAEDQQAEEKDPTDKGSRRKQFFRVKIGDLTFDSSVGQILIGSYVHCGTDRLSEAYILIDDPEGTAMQVLKDKNTVEVELGFLHGPKVNKFVGEIIKFGRKLPSSTLVIAADLGAQMGQQVTSGTIETSAPPAEEQERVTQKKGKVPKADKAAGAVTSAGLQSALEQLDAVTADNQQEQTQASAAEQTTLRNTTDLRFANNSNFGDTENGQVQSQQSNLQAAVGQAARQGDVLVVRGDTVRQVQPGRGDPTDLVLDYKARRDVFMFKPVVFRRTPKQLAAGYGALTVLGWNTQEKQAVGATVTVPNASFASPTGNITVPEWGNVQLSDPIFQGCLYTWGDATRNGERVPADNSVMEAIVRIATRLQGVNTEYSLPKFGINSWYRPLAVNRAIGSSDGSRHVVGDAIDFTTADMYGLYEKLNASYKGGLGKGMHRGFIHLDDGNDRRWNYPGG